MAQEGQSAWYARAGANTLAAGYKGAKSLYSAGKQVGRGMMFANRYGLQATSNWAQGRWGGNYARGGISSAVFAPSRADMVKAAFRPEATQNSWSHIRRMNKVRQGLVDSGRSVKRIDKLIEAAKNGKVGPGRISRLIGGKIGAGFIGYSVISEEGNILKKGRAGATATASTIGFTVGMKVGAGLGAAAGSLILPGIGTAAGAVVGGVVGGLAGAIGAEKVVGAAWDVVTAPIERERKRRKLNWVNDNSAFMTQGAHTMRQQSLNAMNRGMTSARSMLGQEGMMFHQ